MPVPCRTQTAEWFHPVQNPMGTSCNRPALPQPGHRSGKAVVFFMQLVHQFNTIPFDVRKKYRLHAVLNVHNIKFQQRGQFLAVHPELRPIILWHPVHSQINVTVGPVVAPGTGAKQHKPLCAIPPGQCRKLIIKFFHVLTCHNRCVRSMGLYPHSQRHISPDGRL